MGNRAVITLEDSQGKKHPVALYVHWHGGLESVLAFMEYTWATYARGRDDVYTFHARLCQVVGNFFPDGLSVYGMRLGEVKRWADGCDNGHFHWRISQAGVELVGRAAECDRARAHEYWTREHTIQTMIAERMPQPKEATTCS